jgi:hypothetical protein
MSNARDLALALKAKRYGANYSLRIIREARRAGIPVSLGFALVEKESGFRNVFGHDPTTSIPTSWQGGTVTKTRYDFYKARRSAHGMQGVGPCQLTWWATQDAADRLGGCHVPEHNIAVAFDTLAALIKREGVFLGLKHYNGTGPAAELYAHSVMAKARRWHERLV